MMELYTVEIPSIPAVVPKLQWGDSYLEVSRPKEIEDLVKLDDELRKRRHVHFYDFFGIIQARTFTNMLVTNPKYYKQLEPSTTPPLPFNKYYDADELKSSISKRLPVVSPNAVLFPTLPVCNHAHIKMLNIVNQIQFLDADGLLLYRQSNLNIHITKSDEYHILEVPDMLTSQQIRLDPSFFKQFSKKPYTFVQLKGTLCNQKISGSYDIIIMNLHIFKYSERTHTEYRDLQSHLSIASQLTSLLKKGGTFLFSQHYTYFKLTNDFFHILAELFDSVKVIKTINDDKLQPYKTVVCTGFKGSVEFERSIRTIYEAWFLAEASCGMKIGVPVVQRLLGGTIEIKSIQTIMQNSLTLSIKTLQEVEEKIKTPDQLPLYIAEAKLEAKYVYNLMKVFIPISYLFKSTELKAMFHQPAGVDIMIQRSSNRDRVLHSEFNELRSKMEIDLFTMKRQIDYVNNPEQYSKITDLFKITNRVLKYPSRKIIGEPVSQAFLKMCEILHNTPLIRSQKIDVFHLCEAPGQFILAFRHYCNYKRIHYTWTATSLKEGGIGDDYGLIKKYPTQWIWGADGTGNIMHLANIRGFAKKQYDIVTSDCGWPTQDFGFQEEELLQINHGQLTAMLMCLKVGGNCVFKTFLPIMYPLSLSLFYILYIHFEKVIYFKGMLNPSSSEIYVIGINFKGISKPVEDAMCYVVQKYNPAQWLFTTFEKDFIKFHTEAIQTCIENTKKSIIRSILMYHYYNPKEHNELLQRIQNKEGSTWIQKYLLFGKK